MDAAEKYLRTGKLTFDNTTQANACKMMHTVSGVYGEGVYNLAHSNDLVCGVLFFIIPGSLAQK